MQDLDLITLNGNLNLELRTDGGIGLYYDTDAPHGTLMLNREQLIQMTAWLVNYISETTTSKPK